MDVPEKLARQIADKLKHVDRLNMTNNRDQREYSAEAQFGHAMDELHPVIMVFGPGASGNFQAEF